jgi:hypothetical protein
VRCKGFYLFKPGGDAAPTTGGAAAADAVHAHARKCKGLSDLGSTDGVLTDLDDYSYLRVAMPPPLPATHLPAAVGGGEGGESAEADVHGAAADGVDVASEMKDSAETAETTVATTTTLTTTTTRTTTKTTTTFVTTTTPTTTAVETTVPETTGSTAETTVATTTTLTTITTLATTTPTTTPVETTARAAAASSAISRHARQTDDDDTADPFELIFSGTSNCNAGESTCAAALRFTTGKNAAVQVFHQMPAQSLAVCKAACADDANCRGVYFYTVTATGQDRCRGLSDLGTTEGKVTNVNDFSWAKDGAWTTTTTTTGTTTPVETTLDDTTLADTTAGAFTYVFCSCRLGFALSD